MDKVFSFFQYLVTTRPDPNFGFTKLTLATAGVLLLVAIGIRVWRKKSTKDEALRRVLKRYPLSLALFAMALLALLGFRELGFPIFSMRIWWVGLGVWFMVWVVQSVIGFRKEYHERKAKFGHHHASSQYLPKKKKR